MAVKLKPIDIKNISFTIRGLSPLIQHKWSDKALRQIREKQAGKKTKTREARNPEEEAEAATYFTEGGEYGVPLEAIKKSIINAAHKDIGIEKTLVRKSLFIKSEDPNNILPMVCDDPILREDQVRVGMGSADLRYRPEFRNWAVRVDATVDAGNLTVEDLINLVNRAGFGVGLHEWRPEKGGEFGRFEVDTTEQVEVSDA